jgi:hypothetical protein
LYLPEILKELFLKPVIQALKDAGGAIRSAVQMEKRIPHSQDKGPISRFTESIQSSLPASNSADIQTVLTL